MKRDNAFTGLEAAIVLIAFVVVAAIFSYVVLGAGFFATQKAQEVTYAGIKQATSNVVFDGQMYGNVTAGSGLSGFTFSVKVPGGGQPIDMSNTDFVYTSTYVIPPKTLVDNNDGDFLSRADGCSAFNEENPTYQAYFPAKRDLQGSVPNRNVGDPILQPGASAIYTVCVGKGGLLNTDDWFSLEMIPQIGAPTLITKRIDAGLQNGKPLL